ncbi:MAG: hypothetical protein M3Q42_00300 [Pseudomonadota bacterium]|nr:hypothetical protein [Pseudomonadota bacterium]
MSIGPLGPSGSLLAALRAEVSRASPPAKAGAAAEARTAVAQRRQDPALLRKELKDIFKGVAPGDEEAMGQARVRVVRAVLLWEFGHELREHGEWQPMLDTLVKALEASPAHRDSFAQLLSELGS